MKILKKKCGTCKWKVVKKVKTNDYGIFKTRIYAPEQGRWKWRSKVDHSNGYGNTKGKVWTLYFRLTPTWRIPLTRASEDGPGVAAADQRRQTAGAVGGVAVAGGGDLFACGVVVGGALDLAEDADG